MDRQGYVEMAKEAHCLMTSTVYPANVEGKRHPVTAAPSLSSTKAVVITGVQEETTTVLGAQ